MSHLEHRRTVRLDVPGDLTTHLPGIAAPVELRDVGPGGFLILSPVAIPVGTVHLARFVDGDGAATTVTARVIHARRVSGPGEPALHSIGLAFVYGPGERTEVAVSRLIDRITAVLTFD
jgi:hypothetical protein